MCNWITKQGVGRIIKRQILRRATKDKKSWRATIAHVLKTHSTLMNDTDLGIEVVDILHAVLHIDSCNKGSLNTIAAKCDCDFI